MRCRAWSRRCERRAVASRRRISSGSPPSGWDAVSSVAAACGGERSCCCRGTSRCFPRRRTRSPPTASASIAPAVHAFGGATGARYHPAHRGPALEQHLDRIGVTERMGTATCDGSASLPGSSFSAAPLQAEWQSPPAAAAESPCSAGRGPDSWPGLEDRRSACRAEPASSAAPRINSRRTRLRPPSTTVPTAPAMLSARLASMRRFGLAQRAASSALEVPCVRSIRASIASANDRPAHGHPAALARPGSSAGAAPCRALQPRLRPIPRRQTGVHDARRATPVWPCLQAARPCTRPAPAQADRCQGEVRRAARRASRSRPAIGTRRGKGCTQRSADLGKARRRPADRQQGSTCPPTSATSAFVVRIMFRNRCGRPRSWMSAKRLAADAHSAPMRATRRRSGRSIRSAPAARSDEPAASPPRKRYAGISLPHGAALTIGRPW